MAENKVTPADEDYLGTRSKDEARAWLRYRAVIAFWKVMTKNSIFFTPGKEKALEG